MKNIPVDVGQLGVARAIAVAPKTDMAGVQRVDRDGVATWVVSVAVAPEEGRASLIEVAVPGEPLGLVLGMPVGLVGLVGSFWEIEGRAGVSFRAEKVTPLLPDLGAPASAAKPAAAGGGK